MRVVYCGNIPSVLRALATGPEIHLAACVYEDGADRGVVSAISKKYSFPAVQVSHPAGLQIALNDLAPMDLGVIANFGMILTADHLRIPKKGFINIHPGILPENAGRHPVQNVLDAGKLFTGISVHQVTPRVDRGPILLTLSHRIQYPVTRETLASALFRRASEELSSILNRLGPV